MTSHPSIQDTQINRQSYSSKKVAEHWSRYSDELLYGEKEILDQLSSLLNGCRFADVGVGGGRTTKHIAPLVDSYAGIDYSPLLVETCKTKFPELDFYLHDACDIHTLNINPFNFILFSFNGIDCLSEQQRFRFLQNSCKALAPGGHLLFSSHNYSQANLTLSRRETVGRDLKRLASSGLSLRRIYHFAISTGNYLNHHHHQSVGKDIAFLLDYGQGYREILAWIQPERQIADLIRAGYAVKQLFDWYGQPLEREDPRLATTPSIYYLCQKA